MILDTESIKVKGNSFLIGPVSRGVLVRIPVEVVLAAFTDAGFHLVPAEFVEAIDRIAKDVQGDE